MKIAFLYPNFYPIKGGASVHGHYLAKELSALGHQLFTFNAEADSFTKNNKLNVFQLLKILLIADIVYMRMSPLGYTLYLPYIIKLFRKKLIIELNGPVDEYLVTKKFTLKQVKHLETKITKALRNANAVITISEEMKDYIQHYLNYKNVYAIQNGGSKIEISSLNVTNAFKKRFLQKKENYAKLVIWSGTDYPWQGFDMVKKLIESSKESVLFIIVGSSELIEKHFKNYKHVFNCSGLERSELEFIITNVDIGLALYADYSWVRIKKFYGSSLKIL